MLNQLAMDGGEHERLRQMIEKLPGFMALSKSGPAPVRAAPPHSGPRRYSFRTLPAIRSGPNIRQLRILMACAPAGRRRSWLQGAGFSAALVVLILIADEIQVPCLDLVQLAPMHQRVLAAVGDPHFFRRDFEDGLGQLIPIGMVGDD